MPLRGEETAKVAKERGEDEDTNVRLLMTKVFRWRVQGGLCCYGLMARAGMLTLRLV